MTALDKLSFTMPSGQVIGFLGPNGAGKTTSMRTMLGLASIQSGSIELLGTNIKGDLPSVLKKVGLVIDRGLVPYLNAYDNMKIAATSLGLGFEQIPELIEFVDMTEAAKRRVSGYSKGMYRRLYLATAMLGEPELLLLDEPLDGLDPFGQAALREKLRTLVDERGTTVVVSSHILSDIEALADYIVVIHRGQHLRSGTLDELVTEKQLVEVRSADAAIARDILLREGYEVDPLTSRHSFTIRNTSGEEVIRTLTQAGHYPSAVIPTRQSLESSFLELTQTPTESLPPLEDGEPE